MTRATYSVLLGIRAEGLRQETTSLIRESDELEIAGTVASTGELLTRLSSGGVDVVLLHEGLGPLPMMDCARQLGSHHPEVGVVLVVSTATPELLRAALQSGARDVLAAPLSLEELHESILGAGEWSHTLTQRAVATEDHGEALRSAGTMVAVAGAKGGVGTTTIVVHLALEAAQDARNGTVCLVDLDLQAGDVRSLLDLSHRRSIADLVDVADGLTSGQLTASLYTHTSGLRVLLPPAHGEEAEDVTGPVARAILGGIRSRYDTVIVDTGAVVTDANAVAIEMADQVLVVATTDVPALRGANRLLELWRRIDARHDDVAVLLNRTSRNREVQPDLARKVVSVPVLDATVPAAFDELEAAANTGVPERLEEGKARTALRAVTAAVGLRTSAGPPPRGLRGRWAVARSRRAERRTVATAGSPAAAEGHGRPDVPGPADHPTAVVAEQGSITVEAVGVALPMLLVIVLLWQIVLVGTTFVFAGHAVREGARQMAVGATATEVERTVASTLPGAWGRSNPAIDVDVSGSMVGIDLAVPALVPGVASPWTITSQAGTVKER